jgi:hypothetical protein
MSAEQTSRVPASTLKRNSENVSHFPSQNNTHMSPPTTYQSPYSRHIQHGTSSYTNSPPSSFVAVNQVPISGSTASDSYNPTNMRTAPSLPEMSVLSVAPNIPRSCEQSCAAPSPDSQRQRSHKDATSAHMSHSPTPPAAQVGIGHLGNLSQNTTSRVSPLSPTRASNLHYTTGHIADQQNNSSSIQLADASEVTIQQCDLLKLLLRYFFPRNGEIVEESALLNSLEQV